MLYKHPAVTEALTLQNSTEKEFDFFQIVQVYE